MHQSGPRIPLPFLSASRMSISLLNAHSRDTTRNAGVYRCAGFSIIAVVVLCLFDRDRKSAFYNAQIITKHTSNKSTLVEQQARCNIILRDRSGRLGNRLFMFASALGLALTHSCHLHITKQIIQELNQSFTLDLERIPVRLEQNHSKAERKVFNHCSYLTDLFRANTSQTIELVGFWQVHAYFSNHSTEIRRQLHFKSAICRQVDTFLGNVKEGFSNRVTLVGVHIRRGDFLGRRTVSSDQYIISAMSYFIRNYQAVVFVIISDDRVYCQRLFQQRKDVRFTPVSYDATLDLATLAHCDHAIITVGTFGWWGAYLLRNRTGQVIVDAKADLTPIDVTCSGKLFFPPWFSFLNKTV